MHPLLVVLNLVQADAGTPLEIGRTFQIQSRTLGEQRTIDVSLPAGYSTDTTQRYINRSHVPDPVPYARRAAHDRCVAAGRLLDRYHAALPRARRARRRIRAPDRGVHRALLREHGTGAAAD